ncbi:MAG: hypothetical protein IT158_14680 [Bryobacterales bacterium]|nr:hypothetical protein [Bryobacterales bacterium]
MALAIRRDASLFLAGACLYLANNLGIVSGMLDPPKGYVPFFLYRDAGGLAVQMTWFEGFRKFLLLPNFHAPWTVEPGFFTPLKFLVGRSAGLLDVPVQATYAAAHIAMYVFAAAATLYALRVFCRSLREALMAAALALCIVPLASLAIVPEALWGDPLWRVLPGFHDFFYSSADGFFHGGSLSAAFGCGITVLSMALIARFLETSERTYLWRAAASAFASGIGHPSEVVVICIAGPLALFFSKGLPRGWVLLRQRVLEAAPVALGGAAGMAIYAYQTRRYEWLRDQAVTLKFIPEPPLAFLAAFGVPLLAVLGLMLLRPHSASAKSRLLQTWILVALAGVYVPFFPWPQHFVDGLLHAIALFIVVRARECGAAGFFPPWHRKPLLAAFAGLLALSLPVHALYRAQCYVDGRRAKPRLAMSTVEPETESRLMAWMKRHAPADSLVLAPHPLSCWLTGAPMHSFASHDRYSLSFADQFQLQRRFFDGSLTEDSARRLLEEFGIRYVVVPDNSPAGKYLGDRQPAAQVAGYAIFLFPEHRMRPYPGLAQARAMTAALAHAAR